MNQCLLGLNRSVDLMQSVGALGCAGSLSQAACSIQVSAFLEEPKTELLGTSDDN